MKIVIEKINSIINDESFAHELRIGLIKSIEEIYEKSKGEKLYSFGLFTSGEYSWVEITANSLEGLEEEAKEYKSNEHYTKNTIDELKLELKWSPCDWKYHCVTSEEHFSIVNYKLKELRGLSDEIFELANNIESALDITDKEITQQLNQQFINAIKNLNNDKGLNSQNIILGLWMGDQSEKEIKYFVSSLNSKVLFSQFVTESKLGFQVYEERQTKRTHNNG